MAAGERLETSLGIPAIAEQDCWALRLDELPVLRGLSVLSRALGEMTLTQVRRDRVDVSIERSVRPKENPELYAEFGIKLVKLCAEREVIDAIAAHQDIFQDHLRTILGTLQRPRYRAALFPEQGESPRALLLDLEFPTIEVRAILERLTSRRDDDDAFLRITIEDPAARRLDLASIPHLVVEGIKDRVYIAGSTRIASTLSEACRREAERGKRSFSETRSVHNHLFMQLDRAGLEGLQEVLVRWHDGPVTESLLEAPDRIELSLKHVLLALEDLGLRRELDERRTLWIKSTHHEAFVERSQLGRVLEVHLGKRVPRQELDKFLECMPHLRSISEGADANTLAGTSVFLVHHMTAEVLGLIAALRNLGCTDLVCLFVVYGGKAPDAYLAPLLDLPADQFECLGLASVPIEGQVESRYVLSHRYSDPPYRARLENALDRSRGSYLEAMRAVAVPAFLEQLDRTVKRDEQIMIVEDGGYLAPILQKATLSGTSVAEFARSVGDESGDDRDLRSALDGRLRGSIEHTKNGFERLEAIEQQAGSLAFPSASIAISNLKIGSESREVAASILNATESVLHAHGRVLSRRRCVVFGSHGAIGRHLVDMLETRLHNADSQLACVDPLAEVTSSRIAKRFDELDGDWRSSVDLVFGVTGHSVLEAEELESWVQSETADALWLVSGSTKTIEFSGAAAWLDELMHSDSPTIAGHKVELERLDLEDALSGRSYGLGFRVHWRGRGRDLFFVANSMPVNFLFYGVPTEMIDEVLAQLLRLSLGLHRRWPSSEAALLAVDRDVDADCRLI